MIPERNRAPVAIDGRMPHIENAQENIPPVPIEERLLEEKRQIIVSGIRSTICIRLRPRSLMSLTVNRQLR
jgi:hypothetical protein